MRVDQKAEGPRQSMSWLHTWASLILGWLLYAIFVTGTLSFFQNEISIWMKPETHQSVPAPSQVQQMQVALNYLQKNHPDAGSWNIQLPNSRQTTTEVTIRAIGEDPRARRGGTRITLDSATGEVIVPRETRGGGFLYRFHFELYGLPRLWTRWLVGIATMFMLVAIVSGIITHKKIFKDFFTFRSGKGQRSWLDAHNATAVFALPFHLMITFSGLLLLMFMFMPWGINQAYENRQQFLRDHQASMIDQPKNEADQQREGRGQREGGNTERGERGQRTGEHAQGRGDERPQPKLNPAPMTDLAPIMAAVQQQWKDNPIASINIISPNTDQAKIEFRALRAESVAHRNIYASLTYNGVTGADETDKNIRIKNPSIPSGIYNVVTVLHEARGLDTAMRWLLFCSGILGTLMVATGLILWCVKRAPQQQKQGYKSFGYRLVEVTNIAAIIGLPLACAAYFYANRLIPVDVEMRLNWEIRSFFTVWLLTLIYAMFRSHRQAWLDLLLLATLAFALLPIVNVLTGGQFLWQSMTQGQWMIASVDLAMWLLAVIFYFAYNKVKKHQGLPNKKAKAVAQETKA